jgi:hypothetical protein
VREQTAALPACGLHNRSRRGRIASSGTMPLDGTNCQSRHDEGDDTVVDVAALDTIAGHRLDDGPVLAEQSGRLVDVGRVYLDATGPPFAVARDLKEESIAIRMPAASNRDSFLSHSAILLMCAERSQLAFSNLIFLRRVCDAKKFVAKCCKLLTLEPARCRQRVPTALRRARISDLGDTYSLDTGDAQPMGG